LKRQLLATDLRKIFGAIEASRSVTDHPSDWLPEARHDSVAQIGDVRFAKCGCSLRRDLISTQAFADLGHDQPAFQG
jgi:hypothetical protein